MGQSGLQGAATAHENPAMLHRVPRGTEDKRGAPAGVYDEDRAAGRGAVREQESEFRAGCRDTDVPREVTPYAARTSLPGPGTQKPKIPARPGEKKLQQAEERGVQGTYQHHQIGPETEPTSTSIPTSVPTPTDPDSNYWQEQWQHLNNALKSERQRKAQLESDTVYWHRLYKQSTSDSQDEQRKHTETRAALQQSQADAEYWKAQLLAAEADRSNEGSLRRQIDNQLEDSEIVRRAKRLRVDVRNFAISWGGGRGHGHGAAGAQDVRKPVPAEPPALLCEYLCVEKSVIHGYLLSPTTHALLVKAVVWAFLDREVFHRFLWTPPEVAASMTALSSFLEPQYLDDQSKRHIWGAETSNYIADAMDNTASGINDRQACIPDKARELTSLLQHIPNGIEFQTISISAEEIIYEALLLDRMLNQQVAHWTWLFPSISGGQFDPEIMEATGAVTTDQNQKQSQKQKLRVRMPLLVAPALVKRGRSSGEDFEVAETRLRAEVDGVTAAEHESGPGAGPAPNSKSLKQSVRNTLKHSMRNIVKP